MARKKRAWNMTNPLYRYLHRKGKTKTKRRKVYSMARRRRFGRRNRGGTKLFGLGTKGLIGGLGILGVVGAAMFSDQIAAMVPINVPFKQYGVAFAIGGPAGIAAKVAKDMFLGSSTTTGSDSSGAAF